MSEKKLPKYLCEGNKVYSRKDGELNLVVGGIKGIVRFEIRRRTVRVSYSRNYNTYEEEAVIDEPTSTKDEKWDRFVADFVKEVRQKASAATRRF